ncbi:MAG: YbaB/EbfC family nucleoid-associated protein [Clostridia bacterium]
MGGMGNMQQLMKQAQKMQEDMLAAQEELKDEEIVGTSGGGMVEVTLNGEKHLLGVKIKPEVVDPDDIEMLEDMLVAAFNDAITKADALKEEKMGAFGKLGL